MKRLILLLLLPLLGCSPTKLDGRSTAEAYLKAVQHGDGQTAKQLFCVTGDEISAKNPIATVQSWSIVGEEARSTDTSPQFSYSLVTVKDGDRAHQIEVWKSNEVYQHEQLVFDRLKQQGVPMENLESDRAKWSSQPLCVRPLS